MQVSVFLEKTASRKGSLEPRVFKRLAQGELGSIASVESRPSTRQDTKNDGAAEGPAPVPLSYRSRRLEPKAGRLDGARALEALLHRLGRRRICFWHRAVRN